ncbi:ARF GTPase-activating protein GIT2 isoform X6 [Oopsacas minuta]|uniref:ARF GTPase-activating protein GIT2 isoform X6 n=1 Tax=Oopsacas minuta TaxID=111878 RepID=A0AAV7JHL6_9METZ|nr:ARF GTPase-activating protein GIT2 isoform X6 [Oopsacas minuta]
MNNSENFVHSLTTSCADCSFPQVNWISINKGVYLCDDCCSIHRSLGRHLSYVRSIEKQRWPDGLLQMCMSLLQKNSNSIWEHDLYHSKQPTQQQKFNTLTKHPHFNTLSLQNKPRKPQPQDPQTPVKEAYIKSKYQDLAYTQKLNSGKDSPTGTVEDFSQQLHASARTNNLETCLRLLALGAQPSYLHPHRGSSPLHVAGQAGQVELCELLFVYGADPCSLDKLGHTPEECARIAGHHNLADRLLEMQYECSDRLSYYLNDMLPDHKSGEHFIVPEMFRCSEDELLLRSPRQKLRTLNNSAYEDLCQDVFDEIDRRETENAWLLRSRGGGIPFLPNNHELNHLRNQSRQKLGLLSEEEFRRFVSDILLDAKRRQDLSIDLGPNSQSGGTLVPLSDSYNPLIPQPNNEYDIVPEEFRQMTMKGSDITNDERENSLDTMETTLLPNCVTPSDPDYSVLNNEQLQRLESCYQQCQSQVSAVELNVSELQDSVKRIEAKLDQLITQSLSSPTLASPPVPAHANRNKKNDSTVISITSRLNQHSNPNQRHTLMDSSTTSRQEIPPKPKRNTACIGTNDKLIEGQFEPDEGVLMNLISKLVEQISMLMESIRSNQYDQIVIRVNAIIGLSQDMIQVFPENYESTNVSQLVGKLRSSTMLLSSISLVGTVEEPLDTNKLISLVIDVSNSAKRMVAVLADKSNIGRVVSSV